ncbi:PucR family transcriptional regulator [Rubrobacter xylanophilus]|uniref:PucR family transcriptional regulator n=1 Tax=Rubrobacter xylanophilus TaxID=49319 RepID=UPI00003A24FC|nr:helix-turn-helix domain-containing protein [Rubrobacter xylanophilus]
MKPKSLLQRLATSPDLAPFRELVSPLAEHDRRRGSDLIRTLRVYFACGANASEAADRLWLHRNSLLYRLQRISDLTGLDLKDPEARLALQLGLLAMEQKERKGEGREAEHPQPAAGNDNRGAEG